MLNAWGDIVKNIKFFNRVMALITSGFVIFSGCSKKKDDLDNSFVSSNNYIVSELPTTSKPFTIVITTIPTTVNSSVITTTSVSTSVSTTSIFSTTVVSLYTDSDNVILNHFSELGNNIKVNINSSEILESCKLYFIYCVDFLFYDSLINGIKFSDLTDMAKQQLLSDITTIDGLICAEFPDYKDTISEGSDVAYNKASEIIEAGSKNIKDFSRDKLGAENYSAFEEYKDLFVDQTVSDWNQFTDVMGTGKEKVKSWYENFREGQN